MQSKPKKPIVPYFTPDRRQCLILGNIDYSAIRWTVQDANGNTKVKGFLDLLAVQDDMEVFSRNIQQYGFDEDMDIIKKTNLNTEETKRILGKLKQKIV